MTDHHATPAFTPAVVYRDPVAAVRFLEAAFGFEQSLMLFDAGGALVHAEMGYGGGLIYVGSEWSAERHSPASMDGRISQSVTVRVAHDLEGHCARARAAGAVIVTEPTLQFYGERTYVARDAEGHLWTFAQVITPMTPAEWDAASGLTTRTRL